MKTHVLAIAEQFWHRVPGGTAAATEATLAALAKVSTVEITALAANHRRATKNDVVIRGRIPADVSVRFSNLPRPALYESWLRLGYPTANRFGSQPLTTRVSSRLRRNGASADNTPSISGTNPTVVWASSLIVPPTKFPVVATVHDLDFLRHPEYLSSRGRKFFPKMWEIAKQRADTFVCPSSATADDCLAAGIHEDRLAVVPWGVGNPQCSTEDARQIGIDLGLPERFVLWVGAPDRRKNPARAAAAIDRIGCDVVVVGATSVHPEGEAAFAALGSKCMRLPMVNDYMLSALYRLADALLYPSLAEGFGLPILESMIHETPVVTSATTSTAEVAGGAALLVEPTSEGSIADALSTILSDDAFRQKLVADGLIRAGQLSWPATAKGYAEIFRSMV